MRTKVLLLTTAQVASAAFVGVLVARAGMPVGSPLAILAFAVVFGVVSRFEMRLEFRRDQITFSLTEGVLVVSFFVLGPLGTGLAGGLGELVSRKLRGVRLLKVLFNASNLLASMTVAATAFHLLGRTDPDDALAWVTALVAAACFSVLNLASLALVLSIAEGRRFDEMFLSSAPMCLLVTLAAAPVGLIGMELHRSNGIAPLLLVPLGVAVALNSRHAAAQRDEHLRFERLYDAASRTARLVGFHDAVAGAAAEARHLLTAGTAICCAQDEDGRWTGLVVDDRGRHVADPSVVGAIVGLAYGCPPVELPAEQLDTAVRAALPHADALVLASSTDGAATPVVLAAFRSGPSDDTAESRTKTLAAFVTHATMAIGNARLLTEVEEALRQQVDLNRQKGDFVAAVSHELRTPLTSMLASVGTILRLDDRLDGERRNRMLEMAKDQGLRLKRLIEELLTVAAAEHTGMEVRDELVDVHRLLSDVRNELQQVTAGRVVLDVDPGATEVVSDRLKLQQILLNLVENAGKYAPDGPVEVHASRVDGELRFAVRDHGPGIPPGDRTRVFERFVQLDQSSTRRNGGTGLGLYLCRQLAEALGGRLVLDEAPGGGCVFTLGLPLRETPMAELLPGRVPPTMTKVLERR